MIEFATAESRRETQSDEVKVVLENAELLRQIEELCCGIGRESNPTEILNRSA